MVGKTKNIGFTLVELLIVIVVIAILAAISAVAYNGIISRAELSKTKVELNAFGKSSQIFRIDNDSYATNDTGFGQVLKAAGIFKKGLSEDDSYAFCSSTDKYVLVAWDPLTQGRKKGDKLYIVSGTSILEYELTNSSLEADPVVLTKICNQVYSSKNYTYQQWSDMLAP